MVSAETVLELLKNKNIVLVGNSVEILNYEKGEFIDSHDIVIRMGRGVPVSYTHLTLPTTD